MTTCDRCGRAIQIGEWPFCPHGVGASAVRADSCDLVIENLGPTPVRITSEADRRAIMRARGLEEFVRHVPAPGSDRSPYTTDWSRGSIDPYTLAAAQALVSRASRAPAEPAPEPADEGWLWVDQPDGGRTPVRIRIARQTAGVLGGDHDLA
jgi:hypothetical protein